MAAASLKEAAAIINTQQHRPPFVSFNGAANAMDNSGVQDVFWLNVEGMKRIAVRLQVATNALAAFVIQGLVNIQDGTWITIASTSGDYLSPKGILVGASGDLTTLAVGSGWFILDVDGFSKIKIQANSSAVGGSSLAVAGGASAGGGTI